MNFDIEGTNYQIKPEQIVRAMAAFDSGACPPFYQKWLANPNFTKAVRHRRRYYPPKYLIVHVTGIAGAKFNTKKAVEILTALAFSIVDKP